MTPDALGRKNLPFVCIRFVIACNRSFFLCDQLYLRVQKCDPVIIFMS